MFDEKQWLGDLFDKWKLGTLLSMDSATKECLILLRDKMLEIIVEINAGHSDQGQLRVAFLKEGEASFFVEVIELKKLNEEYKKTVII